MFPLKPHRSGENWNNSARKTRTTPAANNNKAAPPPANNNKTNNKKSSMTSFAPCAPGTSTAKTSTRCVGRRLGRLGKDIDKMRRKKAR